MPNHKLMVPTNRLGLAVALIATLGMPLSLHAQKGGGFFDDFSTPLVKPSKSSQDSDAVANAPKEIAAPAAVETLALDLLTSGQTHPSQSMPFSNRVEAGAYTQFNRKLRSKFGNVVSAGESDIAAMNVVRTGLTTLLYSLTVEEHHSSKETNKILQAIFQFGISKAGDDIASPIQSQQYRELFFNEMLPLVKELLEENYFVRLRAAIILANLELKQGDLRKGIKPIPYVPAVDLAVELVNSSEQPEAVKICCMSCIEKGLAYGNFTTNRRTEIARVLANQLLKKSQNWWYQRELIKALQASEVRLDGKNPIVVHALASVLADPTKNKMVRAEAAYALGRVPISAEMKINFELISYELLNFAVSMAEERNGLIQDYSNQPPAPFMSQWATCFGRVYLAYQPRNQAEKDEGVGLLYITSRPGMDKGASQIKETYARIHPFFNFLLKKQNFNQKFTEAMISSSKNWLEEYPPADFKIAPQTEPLVSLNSDKQEPISSPTASR